ncbi:MAG TPA: polysaccharide deacetylase [Spirochaetota bacterium]|nr:polysaccharide deacetylase [Spirochaetota bacterium]HOM09431.1 polysaccharide deacetylase [Spirochaetota bacterium]HPP49260.1 polysaccharide deacetylase [Spirochaetota bacterium]HXK64884.1 polysaccharide deacetylase [Spirochaetota bacterium]
MKQWLYKHSIYCILAMIFVPVAIAQSYPKISAYMPSYALYTESGQNKTTRYIIIRRLKYNSVQAYVYINPDTLHTGILKNPKGTLQQNSLQNIIQQCADTQYAKLYQNALQKSKRMFNAGITHVDTHGMILSFDLCPSKRFLDTDCIEQLIALNKIVPLPVAICISGKWMLTHPEDLQWLQSLASAHQLDITWVNHSFTHFYSRKLPVRKNFMLKEDTSVAREVLQNEICMLEHDIFPSIFFRFPGLISNQKIYEKVMGYGLIPLGADAWLAKGKRPVTGSIILVHPNGNEKKGTYILIQLARSGLINITNIVSLTAACTNSSQTASIHKKQVKL